MDGFRGKTGKLVNAPKTSYYTFEPSLLPFEINYDDSLVKELCEASLSVGNLSGIGYRLKNPHLLITPYLNKEAVLSSKIEGTRTSLSEVFLHEKEPKKKKDTDLLEVVNYVQAIMFGLKEIETKPLSEELIKKIHVRLMKGVRGEEKDPGRYKVLQNWIGSSNNIFGI